jgi:hypothetical protein
MTVTRELQERSGTAAGGEANGAGADRLRQDGTTSKQTLPAIGSTTLAESAARRPERIALQFAIEVCGFDRCGRFFTERSETSDVSVGGCKFYLRTEVERVAVVALRVIERFEQHGNDAAPVLFQVARMEVARRGFVAGADGAGWRRRLVSGVRSTEFHLLVTRAARNVVFSFSQRIFRS